MGHGSAQVGLFSGKEHAAAPAAFRLRHALRSLELFDFVGLTEEFGASMRLLAHTLRCGCSPLQLADLPLPLPR